MIMTGRRSERAELDRLLDDVRTGMSGVLVLRGDAGIGKTALLDHAVASASPMRVTRLDGVESEQELGFAALHRIVLPFLDLRLELPAPQLAALETAFGMAAGSAPDRFLVGLAVLTLMAGAARRQPLLVVCDDAQWVDQESLDVLAFVGRRLHADGMGMLFALRDEHASGAVLAGLPELRIHGLPESDARALLTEHLDPTTAPALQERIIAESAGNPLALRELARSARTLQAGAIATPLPVSRSLEARFLQRFRQLTALSRSTVLMVAADATGDRDLVRRALDRQTPSASGEIDAAFEEAERADVLAVHTGPAGSPFRHPLIRSAVYTGASRAERRAAHAALAAVTDPLTDPDRRAWHLASAAEGPDEGVAAELQVRAERAKDNGGYLARAAFLHRAAELTGDAVSRSTRLLEACAATLMAGSPHRGEELLALLGPGPGLPVLRAHADRLRGLVHVMVGKEGAVALLHQAALALSDRDPHGCRDALLEAVDAAIVVPRLGPGASITRVARTALAVRGSRSGPLGDSQDPADLLLDGHARLVALGHAEAAHVLKAALTAMRAPGAEHGGAVRWSLLGMLAAIETWDIDALSECGRRYADAARAHGALRMLQIAAHANATAEVFRGDLATAQLHFAEFKDVADATGADPRFSHPTDAMLHGWRGDEAATLAAVRAQRDLYPEQPGGIAVQLVRAATVVLGLGQGRYPDAEAAARPVLDDPPPHGAGLVLPGLVEAAARIHDTGLAERALDELAERAEAAGTPWALGLLARSRALLATGAAAEDFFRDALAHLGPTPLGTEKAHTRLLYGEWLRRRRRPTEARAHLRAAHEAFARMGAAAFAERARLELRATGERPRRHGTGAPGHLTPQETRIARMAADGATNQEIATHLFLSASTVEYHLGKVFRKLGITSRRHLRTALPG
ncbi:helix-turn-helix transcriptional regulator [Streptomyces cellostaticus]|uniref:helix-turn-helix transcriptional regulator n=1 Tax=Streptomyces cellostaticus TaxID=67285 RepID=UPI002026A99B|nr:helix-turn-helix transcriptional regulator [Streptomyces cellostaticus]